MDTLIFREIRKSTYSAAKSFAIEEKSLLDFMAREIFMDAAIIIL